MSQVSARRVDQSIALPSLLAASLCIGIWCLISLSCVYLNGVNLRTLLICGDATVLIAPILLRFLRGSFDLFEPLLMAIVALMGMMIFRPLADIMTGNYFEHAYDIGPTYNSALLLVLGANLAFIVGHESGIGPALVKRLPKVTTDFNLRTATFWALLISMVGCTVFSTFLLSNGGLAYFLTLSRGRAAVTGNPYAQTTAYIYNAIGLCVPGSSILFALWLRRRKFIFLALTGIVLTPYLLLMVGSGARSGVIPVLIGLPFMWYYYRQKRPAVTTILVGGLVVALVFSVLRDQRVETGSSQGHAAQEAIKNPVTVVLNLFTSDDDEMFDVIAQEIAVIPEWVPYSHFSVIRDIFVRALPRNFFPNKPPEAGSVYFTTLEPARARHSGAGSATSIVGNFYLDSGTSTSIFYMFVMGVVLSSVWSYFISNQRSLILLIAFSMVPASIVGAARGDLSSLAASLPFGIMPVLLLFGLQRLRLTQAKRGEDASGDRVGSISASMRN